MYFLKNKVVFESGNPPPPSVTSQNPPAYHRHAESECYKGITGHRCSLRMTNSSITFCFFVAFILGILDGLTSVLLLRLEMTFTYIMSTV